MAYSVQIIPHVLDFHFEAGTSRGVLHQKPTWYIVVQAADGTRGIGEAGPLKGLSLDDQPGFEAALQAQALAWEQLRLPTQPEAVGSFVKETVSDAWPSIRFGLETALLDLLHGGKRLIYPGDLPFGESHIPINGLIWMGDRSFMKEQIGQKLDSGFSCLKMKIGAIDFEEELALLNLIRSQFGPADLILRVDANGAFGPEEALGKLKQLARFDLHSIEQPIRAGQWEDMHRLCQQSPIPIALDEELIPMQAFAERRHMMEQIQAPYIILKPGLLGGFTDSLEWIALAKEEGCGWWLTSALESNIGLNGISQFTAHVHAQGHQGLGTGQLYTNNIPSPMQIKEGMLQYDQSADWDLSVLS